MRKTFEFLRVLTEKVTPEAGRAHTIRLAEDGKTLTLSISVGGGFFRFSIDDSDFEKDLGILVEEIRELFVQAVEERKSALAAEKPVPA